MNIHIHTKAFTKEGMVCCQYMGISHDEKKVLFVSTMEGITEDICCYVGVVHALMINQKDFTNHPVHCNNKQVIEWVKKKSLKYEFITETKTNSLIRRSMMFLLEKKKDFDVYFY